MQIQKRLERAFDASRSVAAQAIDPNLLRWNHE